MRRRYDFQCKECDSVFVDFVDETVYESTCTNCGSTKARRIISAVPTQFKGDGWCRRNDTWAKEHERAARK